MRILVDTDPGLGLKYNDVDDGLALLLMLNNPNFEIEGITTVFGNTTVDRSFLLVKKYLNLTNKTQIPYKKGAASRKELGKLNEASRFLINQVKENPKELSLLALGPFTNIATALIHYPEFFDDLKQIVIMGGTLTPVISFNPLFKHIDRRFYDKLSIKELVVEFNCVNDPLATQKIFEIATNTPRIQMGLEICCSVVITDDHIRKIARVDKPIPQFISKYVQFWLKMWKLLSGKGGFYPFDTTVPIYLLHPELYKTVNLNFSVDTTKIPGKLSIQKGKRSGSAPITYCVGFQNQITKQRFIEILISNLVK